jgi:hypothetical protein
MKLSDGRKNAVLAAAAAALAMAAHRPVAAEPAILEFERSPRELHILINGDPLATYVFKDPVISRPYFANVNAPGNVQATRHQPPVAGEDLMDHPTFHPGIWLAFGDLNGADDWRLVAPVQHVEFVEVPQCDGHQGSFAVHNRYLTAGNAGAPICDELFRCEVRLVPAGHLFLWDSTFTSDQEFAFGDQEEMGLGLRVATPLRAQRQDEGGIAGGTGTIRDAEGRLNEAGVWGNSAAWCDYSGKIKDLNVGMTIFTHPKNFRPSWFHARDRGLLVANPFGRAAFRKGENSKVVVKPGESLRLRYGILLHASPAGSSPDLEAAYREYLKVAGDD